MLVFDPSSTHVSRNKPFSGAPFRACSLFGVPTLETAQGQINVVFWSTSRPNATSSVGNWLKICPGVASGVACKLHACLRREIGNLLPNNRRRRRTCYALCHILYPVSAAHTSICRMDSNSTSCFGRLRRFRWTRAALRCAMTARFNLILYPGETERERERERER